MESDKSLLILPKSSDTYDRSMLTTPSFSDSFRSGDVTSLEDFELSSYVILVVWGLT